MYNHDMLAPHIKRKGWIWRIHKQLYAKSAQSIYPNIYMPPAIYDNLQTVQPDIKYLALLKHEEAHLERQRELGLINFGLKYFFSKRFRLEEELIGYKAQMEVLKRNGLSFNREFIAKSLSGWFYLWCSSYKEAKDRLDAIWSTI